MSYGPASPARRPPKLARLAREGPAMAREQAQYDHCLVVAAQMLDLPVPEDGPGPGKPLPPELRALLDDRLAHAGLDVHAPGAGPRATSSPTATSFCESGTM